MIQKLLIKFSFSFFGGYNFDRGDDFNFFLCQICPRLEITDSFVFLWNKIYGMKGRKKKRNRPHIWEIVSCCNYPLIIIEQNKIQQKYIHKMYVYVRAYNNGLIIFVAHFNCNVRVFYTEIIIWRRRARDGGTTQQYAVEKR